MKRMKNMIQKVKSFFQKHQAERQVKIRREFLPEAQEIIEKSPSPMGHFVILVTAFIVLFFVVWSIVGKMDEVATARGKVVTVSGVQNIQAVNAGIVEKVCVKEGEHVKAGQTIILADTSVSNITLQNSQKALKLLKLENQLLADILEGKDSPAASKEDGKEKAQIMNYVSAIQEEYKSRKKELNKTIEQAMSQTDIEKENLKKIGKDVAFLENQEETTEELVNNLNTEEWKLRKIDISIAYKERELEAYRNLYETGGVSKADVEQVELELEQLKIDLEIQKNLVASEDYDGNLQVAQIDNQLQTRQSDYQGQKTTVGMTGQKYQQALESLDVLETEYKSKITALIVQNEDKIRSIESDHEIQEVNMEQQKIVAPVDGIIQSLEVNTKGNALVTAQTVATIVPDKDQMMVELVVLNQDIGYIEVGQSVVMKMDTYNFQEFGKLDGTIVSISPDAVLDEQKGWVYQAKVSIDDKNFRQKNPDVEIGTGLECTAEVKIGRRRIIDFFLEPIVEQFDGSLKVR